mmetsp:Transcript_15045/g.29273  ORF Transcript_15045/g.29273 Transcript_15045/m.29273 type:complete len:222 (-) Transcript_15045:636-1301(-)
MSLVNFIMVCPFVAVIEASVRVCCSSGRSSTKFSAYPFMIYFWGVPPGTPMTASLPIILPSSLKPIESQASPSKINSIKMEHPSQFSGSCPSGMLTLYRCKYPDVNSFSQKSTVQSSPSEAIVVVVKVVAMASVVVAASVEAASDVAIVASVVGSFIIGASVVVAISVVAAAMVVTSVVMAASVVVRVVVSSIMAASVEVVVVNTSHSPAIKSTLMPILAA